MIPTWLLAAVRPLPLGAQESFNLVLQPLQHKTSINQIPVFSHVLVLSGGHTP